VALGNSFAEPEDGRVVGGEGADEGVGGEAAAVLVISKPDRTLSTARTSNRPAAVAASSASYATETPASERRVARFRVRHVGIHLSAAHDGRYMRVFGSSGVRGVAGSELTPPFVGRIAAAAGTVLAADAVGIARDTRTTGRLFADAAASAVASVGCGVHRLGVVPTPAAQAYARRAAIPVVMITASHNPPEYNGVKLISADGVELSRRRLERVEDRLLAEEFELVDYEQVGGHRSVESVADDYVAGLLDALEAADLRAPIADADLTVAVDPGHGAGCRTTPRFVRELGCRVHTINATPDGHFPGRDPEPVEGNLGDLRRLVRATDADVGVAHDGDADRAIFVDETGAHVEGDAALGALAAAELDAGDVAVSAVNVSKRLVDAAEAAGAGLELTPIGSTDIISRIRELRAEDERVPVAGEGNGGILFPDYRLARDGAYTAARFLALLADRSASEVAAAHGDYANVRANLAYDDPAERDAMLGAAEAHANAADAALTTIDGYRLDYDDAWVLARPSGTEPLVRVYAEGPDAERTRQLLDRMVEALEGGRTAA
jgi:phosphomannomutase/phosphoglucomutase